MIKKYFTLFLFVFISVFSFMGCETQPINVAAQNQDTNITLKKAQRIQTLQFNMVMHPEWKNGFPKNITENFSQDEIEQAKRNLKW